MLSSIRFEQGVFVRLRCYSYLSEVKVEDPDEPKPIFQKCYIPNVSVCNVSTYSPDGATKKLVKKIDIFLPYKHLKVLEVLGFVTGLWLLCDWLWIHRNWYVSTRGLKLSGQNSS